MKIFEILIYAIVALALITIIINMFIIPEKNVYDNFAVATLKALNSPGEPVTMKFNLDKKTAFSSLTLSNNKLLNEYNGLLIFFRIDSSLNNNMSLISTVDADSEYISTVRTNKKLYYQDATIFCNSYLTYIQSNEEVNYDTNVNYKFLDHYTYFCEIVLGAKLDGRINANLNNPFNAKIKTGVQTKTINIISTPNNVNTNDLILRAFVFESDKNVVLDFGQKIYFLRPNLDKKLIYVGSTMFTNNSAEITIPFNYVGDYLIVYVIIPKGHIFDSFGKDTAGPADYIVENVSVESTYEDLVKGCKATEKKYSYFDYTKTKCVYYYYCDGCMLPSMCVEAWFTKGTNSLESNSNEYAQGYDYPEACNMQNANDVEYPNDNTKNLNNQNSNSPSDSGLSWPANSNNVSSCIGYRQNFGRNHDGIDISGKVGDPVYAAQDGIVKSVDPNRWGLIVIDHGNYLTRYIHLNKTIVSVGQNVKKGDRIGDIGGRGPAGINEYPPHLHYELLYKNLTLKGNIDSSPGEDVFLTTPEKLGLAVNPLCFYNSSSFVVNPNSPVCKIQGGPLKWCSEYNGLK